MHGDGDLRLVRGIVHEWGRVAAETTAPHLEVQLAYVTALLATAGGGEDVEDRFQSAMSSDVTSWPFYAARARLAFGEWLRRQHRDADARIPLREAAQTFDALGQQRYAERALRELRATGERARPSHPRGMDRAQPSRAPDRPACGRRTLQPRDRSTPLPVPPHHRHPPLQPVPQARHHLARPAARCPPAVRDARRMTRRLF